MPDDFEIGRVIAVDTSQLTIELNPDLKGLTRSTYEGAHDVGRINSYVVAPVGSRRLVAMVTRVSLVDEASLSTDRALLVLPTAKRLVKATLIGTIDSGSFSQGISVFPILDNPVLLTTSADLDAIFDRRDDPTKEPTNVAAPGCCIEIGRSAVFDRYRVQIDPDAFFGKHAAVLGSTGSGKSCTIAALLQSVLAQTAVRRTRFVILDTNGEYRSAFQKRQEDGTWRDATARKTLYIPSDPQDLEHRLAIPYWFLNSDDLVRLFRASQGVQRPVLLEALRLAKNESSGRPNEHTLRDELVLELNRIWSLSGKDEKTSKSVRDLAVGLKARLADSSLDDAWRVLTAAGLSRESAVSAIDTVRTEAAKHVDNNTYPNVIPADSRDVIRRAIEPIYQLVTGGSLGSATVARGVSADAPVFFSKGHFRSRHIEQVLRREESGGARARDFSGTMLLRIDRLLADTRFEFLFGPSGEELPEPLHSLASFVRDIVGLPSRSNRDVPLSDAQQVPPLVLPYYDRQRSGTSGADVVVIDVSLLAAEVLENVAALIGRVLLEFLQRLGDSGGEAARGSLPVVLILEEAQNYIGTTRNAQDESISQLVFERIAREGRKHGLSLVVASQRPSELSKTVLSQCGSFIVHRLQNPEDLKYFKEIVPGVYAPLIDQVPSLAQQTALVLGECVRAPAIVRIRDASPVPRSKNPLFWASWVRETEPDHPVEAVCARWEGQGTPTGGGSGQAATTVPPAGATPATEVAR